MACFMEAAGAVPVTVSVSGPYGESVQAVYAKIGGKAVVEMACAAGLPMVGERKNPEVTTTYGVGQVIRHAVESGCSEVLLGLGGSRRLERLRKYKLREHIAFIAQAVGTVGG